MRKFTILLLLACSALVVSAQKKQVFTISPTVMEQGDQIKIHYDPTANGVPASTEVKGSIYLFRDFKWEGYDLPLVKSDSGYTSNYLIPVGTGMLACRFAIGDSIDRGSRFPYGTVVHAKGKKIAAGSYIEWGLFRSKNANGEMSPLVAKESLIAPNVLVQLWISKEFNNPLVKRKLFFEIANGIKAYMPKEKADSILYKTAAEITEQAEATENDLIAVEKVYRTMLNDAAKADALHNLILDKYPKGLAKRLELIKVIYIEMDGDKKVGLWKNFVRDYPFSSFPYTDYVDPIIGDRSFFSNAYVGVANLSFRKHDLAQLSKMAAEGPFNMINYFYEHYVIYPFRLQVPPITAQEALLLSKAFIHTLMQRIQVGAAVDRGIYAPTEWVKQEMINNSWIIAHHVALLYKDKQYAEAKKIADQVKGYVGYKSIDFNTVYTKLLYQSRKHAAAKAYTVEAIKANTADPEIIALLKAGYVKSEGGGKSFDDYYESLRPGDKLERMRKRLTSEMVKIPAINFNLENLTGKQVDLAKQKGKIVVLDFWASWCFPCKAAMPGMQTLVDKYEPQGDAAFFFIATMEQDASYKKLIHQFLATKKYNFNVLYDAEDPESKKMGLVFNEYAKLLKLSGIPQKVVIDQDGFVRWVSGGFNGDLVGLTNEVSYVIEELKKEKQTR